MSDREGRFLTEDRLEERTDRLETPDTTAELLAEARRLADQIVGWAPRQMQVSANAAELVITDADSPEHEYVLASSVYDDNEIPGGSAFLRTVADMMKLFPTLVDLAGAPADTATDVGRTEVLTISVPAPNIPFPGGRGQGAMLRRAAQNIVDGYDIGGSNVTAAVVQLIRDAGDAVDRHTA
ncbi:hypothetical protein [Agromyces humi]|uniref:hypothetical protein n=1 Tax=Agromyces humi TaxID=1766800 RepID=UPI00135B8A4D|nr:hypothetical protein [Agromyces humi]